MSSGNDKDDSADYVSPYEEEGAYRMQQKKISHNEAEKKRIKTINKCVDDIRDLLDNAKVPHKSDKVSTLEAASTYIKTLMRERDRLATMLGCCFLRKPSGIDIGTMNFLDSSPSPHEELSPPDEVVDQPIVVPQYTSDPSPSTHESAQDMPPPPSCPASHRPSRNTAVDSIDYRRLWMNNNIPGVVVHIETGQLLRGNEVFMKLFRFSSMKELTSLSLFDVIVVNDLSLFWSEYSQLVNCNRQIIRSFIATVTNPAQGISIPCIITMGPIMDYEGYVFMVSVSFTPLKTVKNEENICADPIGENAVSLEKII